LILGTLFESTGNLKAIEKNISNQLTKRLDLQCFSLDKVHCVKFCVPNVNDNTEQAIRTVVSEKFVGFSNLFIGTKEEFPNILFVKVLFTIVHEPLEILDIGIFKVSKGSDENIKKNIRSQYDNVMTKNFEKFNLNLADVLRFTIPIHNESTKTCIDTFLTERFLDKKNRIYQSIDRTFVVDVFLK